MSNVGASSFEANADSEGADLTLVIIQNAAQQVLFGTKTRGFGQGKRVLPGGKTSRQADRQNHKIAAAREVREETGLTCDSSMLSYVGMITVFDGEMEERTIWVFSHNYQEIDGLPNDSRELIDLGWHHANELPLASTPEDYTHWLPHALTGGEITAQFITDEDNRLIEGTVIKHPLDPAIRPEFVRLDLSV